MSPIEIHPAGKTDLEAIVRLEILAFAHDRLSRRSIARLLAGQNCFLAARAEAQLLGYALVLFREGAQVARLYSIAVDPAAAGRGIGRRLLAACEASAAARGCQALRLEVRGDNERAIGFYLGAGYAQFGRREAYYGDGEAALRLQKAV